MSSALDDLPKLRESLEAHGLLAKKSFGQHFLLDLNVTRKIVRLAGPLTGRVVVEVGPGPGGLTRALLESDALHVIAVEKDPRFVPLLEELAAAAPDRLTLVQADALKVDEGELVSPHGDSWKVVSNLPYNVGTPLLVKWLTATRPPEAMTLMFQKEVAERIAAPVGASAYGRLGVLSQAIARPQLVLDLPARAFTPPPKVDSAVVNLSVRSDRPDANTLAALEQVTQAAFGQRRKMLRSSLRSLGGEALCLEAGIDPASRAEQIDINGFLALARAFKPQVSMGGGA